MDDDIIPGLEIAGMHKDDNNFIVVTSKKPMFEPCSSGLHGYCGSKVHLQLLLEPQSLCRMHRDVFEVFKLSVWKCHPK